MARYGVIADVHGNLQALQAVLSALRAQAIEDVVCLGDLVGYNAASNECVTLLRERRVMCISGNHDQIALGRLGFDYCAPRPEFSLRRTRKRLSDETRAYLETLPAARVLPDGVVLIHGGVNDICQYMHSSREVAGNATLLRERSPASRVCFFGHTHVAAIHELHGDRIRSRTLVDQNQLDGEALTFVNPGSVDAARRPDKRAEFAVFDSGRWTVTLHRVPYDDQRAEGQAVLEGYRMNVVNQTVLSGRRLLRRVRRKALRKLQTIAGALNRTAR